jgi:hypothetical protein
MVKVMSFKWDKSTIKQKDWHVGNYIFVTVVVFFFIYGAYSKLGLPFLDKRLKDFVFAIFQMYNLNGTNLSERYWIIQSMIIFMVVVIFHICMWLCINIWLKK